MKLRKLGNFNIFHRMWEIYIHGRFLINSEKMHKMMQMIINGEKEIYFLVKICNETLENNIRKRNE